MSKAALRALKEAVDAEEYEAALQKCDELLKECKCILYILYIIQEG